MALINKPDYSEIWASGGSIVEPSTVKKQTGWTAEVPPYQWENWIQNRQDQYLAHINQRGIPQWDGQTEYEAGGLSYVQGSNGVVYKSVAASGPSTVTQDPTTDVSGNHWVVAFASAQTTIQVWSASVNYAAKSYVIGSNGLIYFSIQASGPSTTVRNPTTEPAYWQQFASHGIIKFDTAGVTAWTVPLPMQLGIIKPKVTVIGAGGAGSRNNGESGSGGGSGGAAIGVLDLTGVASVTITVGAGGAIAASGAIGGAGGSSSFGAYLSATGGGGALGSGGGGAGGTGAGGDLNVVGQGGSPRANGIGTGVFAAGAGGNSLLGGGGRGLHTGVQTQGFDGQQGAGGGGSIGSIAAGAGGAGIVVIEW